MAKLAQFTKTAGFNAGAVSYVKMMRAADIKTDEELSSVFTIEEYVLHSVMESMKENGYDRSQPLVIWKGSAVVVDGHTRLKAALDAGIDEVPVHEKEFATMDEAKAYAYKRQAERRNLTQAEIFKAATTLKIKGCYDGTGRTREKLADDLGVSESTIQHARTVAQRASPEDIEAIRNNETSINKVYQKLRSEKNKEDVNERDKDDNEKESDGGTAGRENFDDMDLRGEEDSSVEYEEESEEEYNIDDEENPADDFTDDADSASAFAGGDETDYEDGLADDDMDTIGDMPESGGFEEAACGASDGEDAPDIDIGKEDSFSDKPDTALAEEEHSLEEAVSAPGKAEEALGKLIAVIGRIETLFKECGDKSHSAVYNYTGLNQAISILIELENRIKGEVK